MEKINATKITDALKIGDVKEEQVKVASGLKITVKNMLSISDMASFVKFVTDSCFDDDTGEYRPEIRPFATRCAIYEFYTNVDLPGDTEEAYKFVYDTVDVLDSIVLHVNSSQFNSMMSSIDSRIEATVSANISTASYQINELYNKMSEATDQFQKMFDGISKEDIDNLFSSLSAAGIDENKFVANYLKHKDRE